MLAAISMNVGLRRSGIVDHSAMQIMGVIVMVVIDRQALGVFAEQFHERRVATDLFRVAGAAHVAVEAHHLVSGAHDLHGAVVDDPSTSHTHVHGDSCKHG